MLSPAAAEILAIAVFAAVGLALAAMAVYGLRVSPFTPAQSILWAVNYLITRLLWRTRIEGQLNLPPGQGAVIVANHRSSLDPSFLAMAIPRAVHWMVAKEFCEAAAFRWFLRTCEVIPTSRGGVDTAATKQAIRWAADGGLVGIFPEGRINTTTATLLPGRSGAALIAIKARVPIVPCYIIGSPYAGTPWSPLFIPARVRLVVGEPIDLGEYFDGENDREALEQITRRMLAEMARLAGDADFEPRLAGRIRAAL